MASYQLTVEDDPSVEDVDALAQGLNNHSVAYTQVAGFRPIGVFVRDERGALVGGVWGYINWNWLWIGAVWLSEDLRGRDMVRKCWRPLNRRHESAAAGIHISTHSAFKLGLSTRDSVMKSLPRSTIILRDTRDSL